LMVTRTKQAMLLHSIPALAMTAVQTAVVGLGCLALALVWPYVQPNAAPQLSALPSLTPAGGFWLATGFLIVFCTLFAFFAQNYALQRTSPTKVALLMGAEPLFGALFAVLALNEHLSWQGWLGGALIIGASWWALRK
jgi:drug/metabolite transporter (DMT)-like permease